MSRTETVCEYLTLCSACWCPPARAPDPACAADPSPLPRLARIAEYRVATASS